MKKTALIAVVFTVVFCMGSSVWAEDRKIGVIDTQKILTSSDYGKAAKEEIQKKIEELREKLQSKQAEIQELKEKVEREAMVMSEEMREKKEREYRIKVGDFQSLEKKAKQEMEQLNMKLSRRIQQDVLEIVEGIGKKEDYLLILDKGSLMYSRDNLDISQQVIEIYNKNYQKDVKSGNN